MKKYLNYNLIILFLFFSPIEINYAFASVLPLTESGLRSAETRTQQRKIQNLKNQVYQNNYVDPSKSTSDLVMEMTMQNKADERLKQEIKDEMNASPKKTQTTDCGELLGENSKYNNESKKCECIEEYKLYGNKCMDKMEYGLEYCKETVGINSKYDSIKDACTTNEEYCREKLGNNAKYSIANDNCECADGVALIDNVCVEEKIEQVETETKSGGISSRIVNFLQKFKFW